MQTVHGFDLYWLNFDHNGDAGGSNEFEAFRQASGIATDAIFIAHGFRESRHAALALYSNFLETFRSHLARAEFREIAGRKYIVGAVDWPAQALPESLALSATQKLANLKHLVPAKAAASDDAAGLLPSLRNNPDAQDTFAAIVLSVLDGSHTTNGSPFDTTEGLPLLRQHKGSVLLRTGQVEDVDTFLNVITWYVMQRRSDIVGSAGVAHAVRDTRALHASIKIHLVGHGLGGRLMASCARSLAQTPQLQPDSITLLEAAFSHYGFSANNGTGKAGVFRDLITKQVVKGPLIATFSALDTVVDLVYAVARKLARDNNDYRSIGRNGAMKTDESTFQPLKPAHTMTTPYIFRTGVVNCLDGSDGLIKNHDDVTNTNVTYAFASALASTRAGLISAGAAG